MEIDVSGIDQYLKIHDANEENRGQSLLYWAVYHNRYDIAKKLIKHGADVNRKDNHGRTPLSTSLFFNFIGISQLLLNSDAKIESTSMDRAIFGWNGHVQIESINLLRQYGWVNLYLDDDLRDIPKGFVGAKTIEDAVDIIENYKVHILSLDHDLVKYVCRSGIRPANRIYLHTGNLVSRENMYQTLLAAQRNRCIDEDVEIYSHPFND